MKLLTFITFKRELVDDTMFDCESKVIEYDTIPNSSQAYNIVNINEYLNVDELVYIVNETLNKKEQIKNLNKTENLT